MKSMDKLTTGVAYGTSAGSAGYWFLQLLDKVTPSQWAAIGVLGSLVPDILERDCGLQPAAVSRVQSIIDDLRDQIALRVTEAGADDEEELQQEE
ncbi:hypothetical protein AXK32_04395 [Escherichia coli]|nr:hypothetical protein AXK32_04395 [Escherichia coli]